MSRELFLPGLDLPDFYHPRLQEITLLVCKDNGDANNLI